MTNQNTAVQTLDEPVVEITDIAKRGDVERFEAEVRIPLAFQYTIPVRKQVDGQWVTENKVGLTSDGYDYLNTVLGASFFMPEQVPDSNGRMVNNPIHRPDYIYLRLTAVWYNRVGQLITATEDLEVDFNHVHQQARLETKGAVVVLDKDGQPQFTAAGHPLIRLPSADDERKAMKALLQLRTMGMRYAQTVVRTRLLKMATGVKSLPGPQPKHGQIVKVVGFRDRMTPGERREKAEADLSALYGQPAPRIAPLAAEEMAAIEPGNVDAEVAETVNEAVGLHMEPAVQEVWQSMVEGGDEYTP